MANIDWKSRKKIDDVVDTLAFSRVKGFYPTIVNKTTEVPLDVVFDYLLTLVGEKELNLKWEIKCPHYDCLNTLVKTQDIESYLGKTIVCQDCYREVKISKNIIFPAFEVSDEYRDFIRDNKKKLKNPLKVF